MQSGTDRTAMVSPAPTTPAVQLALMVLFGDEVATRLDPSLVASLAAQPLAWEEALQAIWTISGNAGLNLGASALGAFPQRNGAGLAPPHEVPAASRPGLPAGQPVSAAPATTTEAAPAAPPEPSPAPAAGIELFDPAADSQGTNQDRAEPWSYDEIRDEFVAILGEMTGYPADVLDEDADLESDLAIDSVKQVEGLATLRERHELILEESFSIRDYRTIRSSATYLVNRLNCDRDPAAALG